MTDSLTRLLVNGLKAFGADDAKALAAYGAEIIGLVGLDRFKDPDQLARRMARRIDNILYGLKR